jgi:hypothetical protein
VCMCAICVAGVHVFNRGRECMCAICVAGVHVFNRGHVCMCAICVAGVHACNGGRVCMCAKCVPATCAQKLLLAVKYEVYSVKIGGRDGGNVTAYLGGNFDLLKLERA